MTTLSTRIGGYRIAIRPASVEEKWDMVESMRQFSGFEPDVSQAHVGVFMDDNGIEQSDALPYDLRGKVQSIQADSIFGILIQHFNYLQERVEYSSALCECFRESRTCDNCKIESAIMARVNQKGRGNAWKFRMAFNAGNGGFPRFI